MQSSHLLDLKDPPRKEGLDFVHKHLSVFIVMLVLLASIFSLLFIKKSSASQVVFYPTTCAGTWNGVQNAIGSPSLADGATLDQFTDQNSAVLGETHGDIYCGQFQGDIPASVHPRTISVHLHLGVDTGSVVHDVVPSVVPPVVPQPDAPSDPSVDTTPVVTPDPTPTQTPAPETVTPAEPAPPDPTAPTVDVIQVPASQPIPEDQTTTPTQTPDPASAQQASLGALFARLVDKKIAAFAPALALDSLDVTPVQFSRPDFLEVRYTTDGTTWKVLGGVTTVNWQDSTFVLNDTAIADWSDLAHLQIGLFSIDGTQVPTSVYLDAMDVSVSYDEPSDALLPTVKVTDPTTPIIVSDKKDFSLNETPTFTIDSSNLSTPEITTLIKDQKAVVVKDDMNVFGEQQIPSVSTALGAFVGGAPIVNMLLSELIHLRFAALALVDMNTAPSVDVAVLSSTGEMTTIPVAVQQVVVDGKDTSQIVVTKPTRMFHPGLYILQVTVHTGEVNVVSEQDFTWGVLALNINKSVYAPGEKVSIQMGVLNAVGHTLCDVDMTLQVIAPSGATQSFATSDNTIEHSVDCHPDAYTDVPDYATHYLIPSEEGTYALVLSATTDSGTRVMYDSFEVRSDAGFSIERTGPTRIYPVASYPITLAVVSDTDWSGSLVERVPAVFEISPLDSADSYNSVVIDGDDKVITWNVSLHKGVLQKFGYQFVAPRISPEFYLLGAAALYASPADGQQVSARPDFQETRQWQIADDAVCTATISGTWNTVNNGSMWTGCTGTGGTPGTADDVTINSSVTVTLGAATPVVNSLTVAGTLDTKSGSNFALNAKTLTVSNTGTLTANGSTITLNGTSDTPFVMNGTFNKGTSLVTFTGTHATTNVQIPALSYYSVTVNKSGETFALTGTTTLDPAGTLNVGNGTVSTTTNNYALSLGYLVLANLATAGFSANNSTVTFTATSGTLITRSSNGSFAAGGSTVVVSSDAAITICSGVISFNNMTLSPALTASRIYTASSSTFTITGNLNINPSAASALTLTLSLGSTTNVTGTTTVQGTGSATSILDTTSFNRNLTTGLLNIASAGTLTANGSTITLNGTSDTPFVMNGTFNKGTSVVTFTGAHATTSVQIPAISYYSITVNKSGETFTLVGDTTLDPGGTLTVSTGGMTTSTNNYALSLGYMYIANTGTAAFYANNSIVTFTGTSGTLITRFASGGFVQAGSTVVVASASGGVLTLNTVNTTLNALTINTNATLVVLGAALTMSNANSSNSLYIQKGVLSDNGFQITGTTNGTLQIDAGAALCLGENGATNATCNNSTTSTQTSFPTNYTNAHITLSPTSTVYYNSNTDMVVSAIPTYGNLSFLPLLSASRAYSTSAALTVNGNLSVAPNTAAAGAFSLTFTLGATATVSTSKTILIQGGGASPVTATLDTSASNYALSTGAIDIEASGTLNARASTVTVANNWTNNGTFTAGTSTVLLNSSSTATVTGTTTFYKLTITNTTAKEVDFAVSGTPIFTVQNAFTVTGHAEQLIKLFSTSPRTQWQFKPTGTTSVSYANIKDSACQSGANLMTTTSSTNGGNNGTCWGFVSFVSLSISDNTIGFGNLSSIAARYATGDGLGSFTETEAHQVSVATNGISGYSLLISGAPLTYGSSVITAIGNANTASSVGTKQFGLRATVLSGGSGGVQTPYSGSGFAYGATANTTSVFAQQSPSDSLTTVYSVRYLANITPATPSGNYATNVTYILVPNF